MYCLQDSHRFRFAYVPRASLCSRLAGLLPISIPHTLVQLCATSISHLPDFTLCLLPKPQLVRSKFWCDCLCFFARLLSENPSALRWPFEGATSCTALRHANSVRTLNSKHRRDVIWCGQVGPSCSLYAPPRCRHCASCAGGIQSKWTFCPPFLR